MKHAHNDFLSLAGETWTNVIGDSLQRLEGNGRGFPGAQKFAESKGSFDQCDFRRPKPRSLQQVLHMGEVKTGKPAIFYERPGKIGGVLPTQALL